MVMVVSRLSCSALNLLCLEADSLLVSGIAEWSKYASRATNFVFRLPLNESYVEVDTYRAAGMNYINNIPR
jgi:hypothetical protein